MNVKLIHQSIYKRLGFTVTELVITISIAALLLALVLPNYGKFTVNQRMQAYATSITQALRLARNQAINRSLNVEICAINTAGTACDYTRTNWNNGWRVWIPSTGEIIQNYSPITTNYLIYCCGGQALQFLPTGLANISNGCSCPGIPYTYPNGSTANLSAISFFQLYPQNCTNSLLVNIDSTGRATSATGLKCP